MPDTGRPTPGSDHGAKISDVQKGVKTLEPAKPKAPQQPVRH